MVEEIVLQVKPFSINASSHRDQRFKTPEYRQWCAEVFSQLNSDEQQGKLRKLREFFNESKHCVEVEITAFYPKAKLLTKARQISATTVDLSNAEKILIDVLFGAKFHAAEFPLGCPNLNLNDKYIISMSSKKDVSPDELHHVVVNIKIVNNPF